MATIDFTPWAVPDLVITLGGRDYRIPPPSLAQERYLLAIVVGAEVRLRLVDGPLPEDLAALHDKLSSQQLAVLVLGDKLHGQMVADGHPTAAIDRVAYYAAFHWVRGKAKADVIAQALWGTPTNHHESNEAAA